MILEALALFLASFFGCVLGGAVMYEYSAWRTFGKLQKYGLIPTNQEMRKVTIDDE